MSISLGCYCYRIHLAKKMQAQQQANMAAGVTPGNDVLAYSNII